MILVDSSVWIDHLRESNSALHALLIEEKVMCHPFVIGEMAMGSIKDRDDVLDGLDSLPRALVAHDDEVLHFVAKNRLFVVGIGYVDAHLLATVQMTPGSLLWTRDKRLLEGAERLHLAFQDVSALM